MYNHFIKKSILFLMLVISIPSFGQWGHEKGKGYYKVSSWLLISDQHFTDQGEIDPNATRGQFNVNFYGEYGLTDKWDLVAYIPFFARTYQNDVVSGVTGNLIVEGDEVNAIGDIEIGTTYSIFKTDKFALSGTLKLGIPTGENEGGRDGSYQTGDGEFNQLLQIDAGIPFKIYKASSYAKGYIGYNNRTENFSSEWRTGLEIGANLWKDKLWVIGKLQVVESLNNGSLNAQNSQGSIFANNVEYVNLGGEISYYFTKKWGASLGYTGILSGQIIYASPSYTGGVFLDVF